MRAETEEPSEYPQALAFTVKDIDGNEVHLSQFVGQVLLIVNVASKCGNTPQYKKLQALHEEYAGKGLKILGFPCNQFKSQEPGSEAEIKAFCELNYGVKFDLFSKIDVNGPNAAPLFKYLTSENVPIADKGPVEWNFEKFLVDRQGCLIARFRDEAEPDSVEMRTAIAGTGVVK